MLVTYSNGIYVYQQNSLLDYTEVIISDESFNNTFAVPTYINGDGDGDGDGDGVWDYFAHSSGSRIILGYMALPMHKYLK